LRQSLVSYYQFCVPEASLEEKASDAVILRKALKEENVGLCTKLLFPLFCTESFLFRVLSSDFNRLLIRKMMSFMKEDVSIDINDSESEETFLELAMNNHPGAPINT
jgi:hypothetical protein